jgi:ClpP class serine protease
MPHWGAILKEIQAEKDDAKGNSAAHKIRLKYLFNLNKLTGRNVICYYSGFLQRPGIEGVAISDEDKHAFMDCVSGIDRRKGLDLLLHTPGGNIAATESIVDYLRGMFGDDIRAVIPQIAMSAGTLIACACKSLVMGKHSNIGPVDPQIYGFSAHAVVNEVMLAYQEIKQDPDKASVWHSILSRYSPGFVQLCQFGIENSRELTKKFLLDNMFKATATEPETIAKVEKIAETLIDLSKNKSHDKHLLIDDCRRLELEVVELEGDKELQDAILSVHHCYMYILGNMNVVKAVENHASRRYLKTMVAIPSAQPFQFLIPPSQAVPP